jgi:hypothetical protein
VTAAVIDALPASVPVTVNVYFPAVVAGVAGAVDPDLPPPPHPIAEATTKIDNRAIKEVQRRRCRQPKPHANSSANNASPPRILQKFLPGALCAADVDAAVVFTVSTLVPVPPEVTATLAGFMVQVGRLCAPVGEVVSAQLRFRVPV